MRLTPAQQQTIRRLAVEVAGPLARVRLFGSRVDDSARGGDIDLLVELPVPAPNAFEVSLRLGARLERALGGRKVDVLVAGSDTPDAPILRAARTHGVSL